MRKQALIAVAICGAMGLSLVACVPDVEKAAEETGGEPMLNSSIPTAPAQRGSTMQEEYAFHEQLAEDYAPRVVTKEDGRQVQLTPDSLTWRSTRDMPSAYNILYLNADERGCESCHTNGLADLVDNHLSRTHYPLDWGLGTKIDVNDCVSCHREQVATAGSLRPLSQIIHGIHERDSFDGDCMSCHIESLDGEGFELWENGKYDAFMGVNKIENVQGNFTFDQDTLAGEPIFTYPSFSGDVVAQNLTAANSGPEPSDEMFDTWEISISGMVDNPFTITLKDLVEQAPSETFISKGSCCINSVGGEYICNVEVTGVPLSWVLDKAGVQDGAVSLTPVGSDGFCTDVSGFAFKHSLEDIAEEGAWLVYEINGERLSNGTGFPVRLWAPTHSISASTRWLTEMIVTDEPAEYEDGSLRRAYTPEQEEAFAGEFVNKPTAGICNTYEGEIIKVGEEYVFEGYANGDDEDIVAVEFSMDNGKTWTRYETPNTEKDKWVYWHFGFTPQEKGAYVLSVRAVSDGLGAANRWDKLMVNAK
ncbi:molybdopterin-dependent oxidoreductase [Adlercreutzia sp. R25]|uniref:molybdopterin-dependent oxidoreductase n=1 Tax=Adlercreutzia shanghongiae TaxID=3111773 RepID=UPI002DBF7377|nr:molybdopterin-dependent oxidoreductase [Adlercreutzia sp. R25]MEC4273693.1 molybdopterin-dependent oxidoreductase [Adlercreutzia sp. R25]